jgi:hypothetical protein
MTWSILGARLHRGGVLLPYRLMLLGLSVRGGWSEEEHAGQQDAHHQRQDQAPGTICCALADPLPDECDIHMCIQATFPLFHSFFIRIKHETSSIRPVSPAFSRADRASAAETPPVLVGSER